MSDTPLDLAPYAHLGANLHKHNCQCKVCISIRTSAAQGKPPKKERTRRFKEAQAARVEKATKLKQAQDVAVGFLAAQAVGGATPNPKQAMELATKVTGVSQRTLQDKVGGASLLDSALSLAGVTEEKVAAVIAGGLDATAVKTATDKGVITDERFYADWSTRHKYVDTFLTVKGYKQPEEAGSGGGLIIVAPTIAVNEGHKPNCPCDQCLQLWEDKVATTRNRYHRRTSMIAEATSAPGAIDAVKVMDQLNAADVAAEGNDQEYLDED